MFKLDKYIIYNYQWRGALVMYYSFQQSSYDHWVALKNRTGAYIASMRGVW